VNPLEVGFLESLAWRADGEIRVALHLPTVEPGTGVEVRFRLGERRVRRPGATRAATSGSVVEVSAPAPRLGGGVWRIAVRLGDAPSFTPVEARLLVRRGQPIALLPGRPPHTRMPEPAPHGPAPGRFSVRAQASRALRVVRAVRRRVSARAR
jgi:hypothetical protein